jgi:hypothetical protein
MPTFRTLAPVEPPPLPGVYIAKIVKATERVSEAGNSMIVMVFELPDRRRLPCVLTFVEQACRPIDAFCSSAELIRPSASDIEVELRADHCLNRYVYFKLEHDADGAPKIVRFIDRAAALAANPRLAEIALQPQAPITLPVVRKSSTPTALGSPSRGDSPSFQ